MIDSCQETVLFGGIRGWNHEDWTDSDDRVRGGKSQSHLDLDICLGSAIFRGNLDIETLGGAGFASQRTTGEDRCWDLTDTDGIQLTIQPANSDDKKYTFILKDEVLPLNPENGREQSTTSWEFDFHVPRDSITSSTSSGTSVFIPWRDLQPTYRGKKTDPDRPLRIADIKRISIMMRSFFGTQHGVFALGVQRIAAVKFAAQRAEQNPDVSSRTSSINSLKKDYPPSAETPSQSLWSRLLSCCHL